MLEKNVYYKCSVFVSKSVFFIQSFLYPFVSVGTPRLLLDSETIILFWIQGVRNYYSIATIIIFCHFLGVRNYYSIATII